MTVQSSCIFWESVLFVQVQILLSDTTQLAHHFIPVCTTKAVFGTDNERDTTDEIKIL